MPLDTSIKKVLVIGSGPIVIGQAAEFDYAGAQACRILKEAGVDVVLCNSNPATIMTDQAMADEIYLEPLTTETIKRIIKKEKPDSLLAGLGGQTGLTLAMQLDKEGFLEEQGVRLLGTSPESIRKAEDRQGFKDAMEAIGQPCVTSDVVESVEAAVEFAGRIGYPVMLKAASGGGGKGIRVAESVKDLKDAYDSASAEAIANFGDGRLYMEKYIHNPRHIEVQILGDNYGNVVHLFERECSVQRRHQKLIEESPSAFVTPELREKMTSAAVALAKRVGYRNAGTIEFLVDNDRNFYFCEMNTRIQVEHPVTEEVTGVDLVCEQLRVAAGEPLSFKQEDLTIRGHAIECRINAEDPSRNFAPCPGTLVSLHLPGGPGVRVDTHLRAGDVIPPTYDSLMAKLIVWGDTREEAIARGKRALDEFVIEGVATTIPFHRRVLDNATFNSGMVYTDFIESETNGGQL